MATREYIQYAKDGIKLSRHCNTLATGKKIYGGTLAMQVNGVATPLVSGTDLQALSTLIAGADANGDIFAYASQSNVALTLTDPNANNASLVIRVNFAVGGKVNIIALLATGNAGAITTTANQLIDALRAHPIASKYLTARVRISATGASAVVATAITNINYINVLGVSSATYDNAAGGSPLTVPMTFTFGYYEVIGKTGDAPTRADIGSEVILTNDLFEVGATLDSSSLRATLIDVDSNGTLFAKIGSW